MERSILCFAQAGKLLTFFSTPRPFVCPALLPFVERSSCRFEFRSAKALEAISCRRLMARSRCFLFKVGIGPGFALLKAVLNHAVPYVQAVKPAIECALV